MSAERRGWVIRTGTIKGQLETGGARRFWWRAAALRDGTSRVMGDCQARICEGLGVKFPGPTRRGHEYVGFGANRGPRFHWFADSVPSRDCFFANWFLISKLSFAKTPHEAILIRVTCYTASLYVIDFTCALNFGEAQECRDKNEHRLELCRKTNSHALKHFEIFERHTWELGAPGFVPAPSRSADGLEKIRH